MLKFIKRKIVEHIKFSNNINIYVYTIQNSSPLEAQITTEPPEKRSGSACFTFEN